MLLFHIYLDMWDNSHICGFIKVAEQCHCVGFQATDPMLFVSPGIRYVII